MRYLFSGSRLAALLRESVGKRSLFLPVAPIVPCSSGDLLGLNAWYGPVQRDRPFMSLTILFYRINDLSAKYRSTISTAFCPHGTPSSLQLPNGEIGDLLSFPI